MSATVFDRQGDRLTVRPEGRLDTAASPAFEKEVRLHLDGVQELIIDFSDVNYIASGGLRALLTTEQQMESRGGSMKVIHVSEIIYEIFQLVGFTEIVTVEKD